MDSQHLSKFNLIQLLTKDKETIRHIKNLRKVQHNVSLSFNVSANLHLEFSISFINDRKEKYTIDDYEKILLYFKSHYTSDDLIACGGFIFSNEEVGTIEEWYITDSNNIGVNACINGNLEENILSTTHLVKLTDAVM